MPAIAAVRGALPRHRYPQHELTATLARVIGLDPVRTAVLQRLHANAGVATRHLAFPLEDYEHLTLDFGTANDAFVQVGTDLAERAVTDALAAASLRAQDVDLIVSTTVTGIAVPSLDARLMARLPFRPDLRRLPLAGLGCVGGAAGVARVREWLAGEPDGVAVLLAVELCSLTLQQDDDSTANLVASGLFGDGAAAVVMLGDRAAQRHALPGGGAPVQVVSSRSRMYADTAGAMGWDVGASGLRIVLGTEVPDLVREHVREDVDQHLARHGLTREDIGWWVAHPGGPKVLQALAAALEVDDEALGVTWRSLHRIGNLSSVSVLHVLADTLADHPPAPGSHGLLMAMGPGFCLETVLLQAPWSRPEPTRAAG
ncbi:type III polyketide synthase [Ornithinimicrobium pratense]|uniref:Type III polyketide synthase n=1 Tax=Ornithinimicrobium pratense TaxID=2593973 RepID=A0A5J6V300_9MICO|nr:3-oxoacyl-[acyl-carrier-protein] synthase III C-terminal domain-containing protein [Ornithinimicrobium pratense]QFG68300.1 type III polyketide synthase [Ornithinimicrobium pratense]